MARKEAYVDNLFAEKINESLSVILMIEYLSSKLWEQN